MFNMRVRVRVRLSFSLWARVRVWVRLKFCVVVRFRVRVRSISYKGCAGAIVLTIAGVGMVPLKFSVNLLVCRVKS